MPLRICGYQVLELLAYAKQNPKEKLPGILSFIYHQGSRPWKHSVELRDQFQDPNFYERYFAKPILIDLAGISDDELSQHSIIGGVERVLKKVFSGA